MRLGINTFLFACPFNNKHTSWFPKFRQWGYDSVELAVAAPSDMDPIYIRDQLAKNHLAAHTLCGAFGPDRDLRGTTTQQKTSVAYIKALIGQMQVLGGTVMGGPMYSSVGRAEPESPAAQKAQRKLVVKHLKHLGEYAGERGVTLAIEPLNRFETDFLNTCEQALEVVHAVGSPAVKVHLDTFHMNIEEKDLGDAIRQCGRNLALLHASGSDRGTPGNDHQDWKGIAAALRAIKYKGDVVVESFTQDVEVIARAAAIWRRIEPTRNEIASKGAKFLKTALK